MIHRRRLLSALMGPVFLAVLAVVPGAALGAEIEARAGTFVRSLSERAVDSLTVPDTPRNVRIERFRTLFNDHFAVKPIGRFVLGHHWRTATEKEQVEYLDLFEDLMVVSYVDRFQRYAGETLKVIGTRADGPGAVTVTSDLARPGGRKPIRILWRVGISGDTEKVLDLIVEGVSMSQTLRSDFGSIIRQKDGRVAGLLEELRLKTASLKEAGAN